MSSNEWRGKIFACVGGNYRIRLFPARSRSFCDMFSQALNLREDPPAISDPEAGVKFSSLRFIGPSSREDAAYFAISFASSGASDRLRQLQPIKRKNQMGRFAKSLEFIVFIICAQTVERSHFQNQGRDSPSPHDDLTLSNDNADIQKRSDYVSFQAGRLHLRRPRFTIFAQRLCAKAQLQ